MNERIRMSSTFASSQPVKGQLVNGVNVDEIIEIFWSLGYECRVNSQLAGASGVKHPFDIIARRDSEIIVMDLVSFRASILDTPASDAEVVERIQIAGIQIRAKAWDCGAYQCLVIYLSSYFSVGGYTDKLSNCHYNVGEISLRWPSKVCKADAFSDYEGISLHLFYICRCLDCYTWQFQC